MENLSWKTTIIPETPGYSNKPYAMEEAELGNLTFHLYPWQGSFQLHWFRNGLLIGSERFSTVLEAKEHALDVAG